MIKSLLLSLSLGVIAVAATSCCATCGGSSSRSTVATTETSPRITGYRQVEQIVGTDAKSGMNQVRVVQEPVYEEVATSSGCRYWFTSLTRTSHSRHSRHSSSACVRHYHADHGPCGTTGPRTMAMASAQGSNGAPQIGLIPTMRPLAGAAVAQ